MLLKLLNVLWLKLDIGGIFTFEGSVGMNLHSPAIHAQPLQALPDHHKALVDADVLLFVLHHTGPLPPHLVDDTEDVDILRATYTLQDSI